VTFEFARSQIDWAPFDVPQFKLQAVAKPVEDPSGKPISLRGRTFAEVVFHGASGWDLAGKPTYRGPSDFRPGFPVLAEARAAGDFERVLSWAFGLSQRSCWHVSELKDPIRLVIDFPSS